MKLTQCKFEFMEGPNIFIRRQIKINKKWIPPKNFTKTPHAHLSFWGVNILKGHSTMENYLINTLNFILYH